MKQTDLDFTQTATLPQSTELFRVQRRVRHDGDRRVGRLRLPPLGLLSGRFDVPDEDVGYFAAHAETAGYEALARREDHSLSLSRIAQRELICLKVSQPLALLDLRPHAKSHPVLQSMRFKQTQELAADASKAGFCGIVYRSAQQADMDCFAVFGPWLKTLRLKWAEPLVAEGTGSLHYLVEQLSRGACIPVVP